MAEILNQIRRDVRLESKSYTAGLFWTLWDSHGWEVV
jgi:hypothetical protein